MASIEFVNVTKRFGKTLALDDVSFKIEDNEFFCFFGPPLCGKSTVLRLMLGLDRPDSGYILIDDKEVNHVGPAARNIAMVFQNLALFPHMTAKQNVSFPLVERKVASKDIEKRVSEVSEKLHMTHILHKHPAHLSGGERQRVAIARALVRDPVAFLMDDPISALDARLREQTRIELKRIQREVGHTLIYVTHDQEEAMSIADRMAIMREGTVQQIGTPTVIYSQPVNAYVASILGAPEINLMDVDKSTGKTANGVLTLPPELPSGIRQIGIRPENASLTDCTGSNSESCTVEIVEPLGSFTVVTLSPPQEGEPLRLMLRGQPQVQVGAKVAVDFSKENLMAFDETGNRMEIAA